MTDPSATIPDPLHGVRTRSSGPRSKCAICAWPAAISKILSPYGVSPKPDADARMPL